MSNNIVLSSRVRLARNIKGKPFVNNAALALLLDVRREVSAALPGYGVMNMESLSANERRMLVERHLISKELAENAQSGAVCLSNDQKTAIMLNEEDHIRIQAIADGLALEQAYAAAVKADEQIKQTIQYAYDDDLGYLTCCPTNVGTGMRASAMLHLPALVKTNKIQKVMENISKMGITVRGMYGEGSKAEGDIFQISNSITLGVTPREIIDLVTDACNEIVRLEEDMRSVLAKSEHVVDKVCRAYGVLSNARMLTLQESMQYLSEVKLGIGMGVFRQEETVNLDDIIVKIQPAVLAGIVGDEADDSQEQKQRAALVRQAVEKMEITV